MNRGEMGLLSLFQTRNRPAGEAPPTGIPAAAGKLWRKTDFIAFAAGDETQILYSRHGPPAAVPAFTMEFAMSCEQFRPLEEHVAEFAEKHGWHALQIEALQSWLPSLIHGGALISSAEVYAQCAVSSARAAPPPPIRSIGFPTGGNRVPLLSRAIASFAANLRQHGRAAEFVIADGSAEASQRAAFRTAATQLSRAHGFPVLISGEEERRRFAAVLVKEGACSAEGIEFAIFDPLKVGFSCGANRNVLLLHGAGEMLCSVDDDVVCELAEVPEQRPEPLSLFSNCDPFSRWIFPRREDALAAAQRVDRDFLAAHEALLGHPVAALAALLSGRGEQQINLADAGDSMLRRLALGSAEVRSTYLGHFGDPGIPSSCYYFYYEGENQRRLAASEAHFCAALASRHVLSGVPARSLGDASISPGMAMGLDHRELLPPFFPVLHAEDFTFGATVWQCCPGSLAGHQPVAIHHDPEPGKTILQPSDLGPERRVVIFEFAHLLRRLILDFAPGARDAAAERMRALGRFLGELARLPHADFVEMLREKVLELEGEKLEFLEESLTENRDAPGYWREEVEHFLQQSRAALQCDDFDIPYDLKTGRTPAENRRFMQRLFSRYAALLQEWPAIVEASRALRARGITLAVTPH